MILRSFYVRVNVSLLSCLLVASARGLVAADSRCLPSAGQAQPPSSSRGAPGSAGKVGKAKWRITYCVQGEEVKEKNLGFCNLIFRWRIRLTGQTQCQAIPGYEVLWGVIHNGKKMWGRWPTGEVLRVPQGNASNSKGFTWPINIYRNGLGV